MNKRKAAQVVIAALFLICGVAVLFGLIMPPAMIEVPMYMITSKGISYYADYSFNNNCYIFAASIFAANGYFIAGYFMAYPRKHEQS